MAFDFFKNRRVEENPYNIQILNFSAPLFQMEMKTRNKVLLSNLIYLRNIDPIKTHTKIDNNKTGVHKVKIWFPMLFIPAFKNIEKHLICMAFSFNQSKQT